MRGHTTSITCGLREMWGKGTISKLGNASLMMQTATTMKVRKEKGNDMVKNTVSEKIVSSGFHWISCSLGYSSCHG